MHCGLLEGIYIALFVSRKYIMVYILLSDDILTGYEGILDYYLTDLLALAKKVCLWHCYSSGT